MIHRQSAKQSPLQWSGKAHEMQVEKEATVKQLKVFCLIVVAGILFAARAGDAQALMAGDEMLIEMLKHDIKDAKTEVLTSVMKFSAEDAALFWPIYKTYQDQAEKLSDERLALIKEYGAAYWSITDSQASDIAKRWFALQNKRSVALQALYSELAEKMTASTALKATQLEYRLNLILDMQIANELPMID